MTHFQLPLKLSKSDAPPATDIDVSEARPVRASEWEREQALILSKAFTEEGVGRGGPDGGPPRRSPVFKDGSAGSDSAGSETPSTSEGTDDVTRVTNDLRRARQLKIEARQVPRETQQGLNVKYPASPSVDGTISPPVRHLGDSRRLSISNSLGFSASRPPLGSWPQKAAAQQLRRIQRGMANPIGSHTLWEVQQEQRAHERELQELRILQERRMQARALAEGGQRFTRRSRRSVSSGSVIRSQGLGSQCFGSQCFGSQGFGSQGSQVYHSLGFESAAFGSQGFSSQGFGSQGFGSLGFGSQGFGSSGTAHERIPTVGEESIFSMETPRDSSPASSDYFTAGSEFGEQMREAAENATRVIENNVCIVENPALVYDMSDAGNNVQSDDERPDPSSDLSALPEPIRYVPSEVKMNALPLPMPRHDFEENAEPKPRIPSWHSDGVGEARDRQELENQLQQWVFSDPDVVREVHHGRENRCFSIAKETNHVDVNCDVTGAACINQYVVVKNLGQGSHGRVRMCLNVVDGQLYAVKTIKRAIVPSKLMTGPGSRRSVGRPMPAMQPPTPAVNHVLREIAVMKKLDHRNVVKLLEVIDPPGKADVILVTEYLEKGTLLRRRDCGKGKIFFKKLKEENAVEQFRMVCQGLDYMHYNGIVHGDLKPDNILVSGTGEVKIADFTCSRMVSSEHFTSGVYGTPAFHAPEVISGEKYNPYIADIWALGVCMYCAVVGELPFSGPGIMGMYKSIMDATISYPENCAVTHEFKDLLSKIFVKEASKRIDLEGIMQHPWMTENGKVHIAGLKSMEHPPSVIKVTTNDEDSAIDRSSVVSFIRAKLKKRKYGKGASLYQEGDPCSCLFFILEGTVALTGAIPVVESSSSSLDDVSLEIDVDEELLLAQQVQVPDDGVLKLSKKEAKALQERRRKVFLNENKDRVTIQRGPGQMLGELTGEHSQSATAQTSVTVLKLAQKDLEDSFLQHQERMQESSAWSSDGHQTVSRTMSSDVGQSWSSDLAA